MQYAIPCGKKTISLEIPGPVPVQWVESRKMHLCAECDKRRLRRPSAARLTLEGLRT
jgi:hypothetical protein